MNSKKIIYALGGVLISVFIIFMMKNTFVENKPYIFINETEDHRFDESIRMSIMAASKRTGIQNAVIITNRDLITETIEIAAEKAFDQLGVGKNHHGRGILYFYHPKSKSLKIEVGYALEGILTDNKVSGLELAAKTFIYSDRYQDFWAELINTLNIEVQDKEQKNPNLPAFSSFDYKSNRFFSGGAGITSHSYTNDWDQIQLEIKKAPATSELKFGGTPEVESTLNIYLETLRNGIGDSQLDLLTPESQLFRETTPMTKYQLYRNWQMYVKAGVDKIFKFDQLAFVFFRPNVPVLPIVLKNNNGIWKISETLSWSLFQRFEDSNKVFLKFPLDGISEEMKIFLKEKIDGPIYPLKNAITLDTLNSSTHYLSDCRTLYFQFYWLSRVAECTTLEGENRWLKVDSYLNLGQVTNFLKSYEMLAKLEPSNKMLQENLKFYKQELTFNKRDWRSKF